MLDMSEVNEEVDDGADGIVPCDPGQKCMLTKG